MTLTVTGTLVSRVGRLMCMDSTLTTRFSRTRMTIPGYLICFLLGWPRRLTSPVCSQSSNAVWAGRDVEIQSNLSEREFHCSTVVFVHTSQKLIAPPI